MDDRTALLQAIRRNPGDNMPRLAYADWLRERGRDTRADLIQWQIHVSNLGEQIRDMKRADCRARRKGLGRREGFKDELAKAVAEQESYVRSISGLIEEYEFDWVAGDYLWEWFYGGRDDHIKYRWNNGFIEDLECPWGWYERNYDNIRSDINSVVRRVTLRNVRGYDEVPIFEFGNDCMDRFQNGEMIAGKFTGIRFVFNRELGRDAFVPVDDLIAPFHIATANLAAALRIAYPGNCKEPIHYELPGV